MLLNLLLLLLAAPLLLPTAASAPATAAAAAAVAEEDELRLKEPIDTAIRSCCSFSLALLLLLLPPPLLVILERLVADAEGRKMRWPLQVDEVSGSNTSNTWGSGARVVEDAAQLMRVLRGVTPPGDNRRLPSLPPPAAGAVPKLPVLLARLKAALPAAALPL
jgi:hypothetical protein